jgi:post-segregation antitoxin (ccd killing protein)
MTTPRNRGPRWSSPKQADRGRPGRMVYLPRDLHAALDRLREGKANVSAIAEEALRAHPTVAAALQDGSSEPHGSNGDHSAAATPEGKV